jgi:hypothetical protein
MDHLWTPACEDAGAYTVTLAPKLVHKRSRMLLQPDNFKESSQYCEDYGWR